MDLWHRNQQGNLILILNMEYEPTSVQQSEKAREAEWDEEGEDTQPKQVSSPPYRLRKCETRSVAQLLEVFDSLVAPSCAVERRRCAVQ